MARISNASAAPRFDRCSVRRNRISVLRLNELYVRISALVYEHGFFFPNTIALPEKGTKNQDALRFSPIAQADFFSRANVPLLFH